jgi:hypothetical protein
MADANPFLQSGETYVAQTDAELKSAETAVATTAAAAAQAVKNLAETKARSAGAHVALDALKLATGQVKLPSAVDRYVAIGGIVLLGLVAVYALGHHFAGWPL